MEYSPSTRLYGVIGNPVKHSASPRLFNTIFRSHNYDGVYLGFENSSLEKLIKAMRSLSISGYSVTLPFKEEVMAYLDEIDETARRLRCANTIRNDHGRLIGYNFDGRGALDGLEELTTASLERDWRKSHFIFLGNGGAARGILLTLVGDPDFQGRITVFARNVTKTDKLFSDVHSQNPHPPLISHPWEKLNDPTAKPNSAIVINTTSLGMTPHENVSPVPRKFWTSDMVAYDIVYNPLRTRFLREAEEAGAYPITGLNMFLGQARLQLLTWTGIDVTLEQMHHYFGENGHEKFHN